MTQSRNFLRATFAAAFFALAGAPLLAADAPTVADAPPQSLSPAVQAAIADLGAEDYKTRQEAINKLQLAFGTQLRDLISSNDPEIQARIISLLQFEDGLTRWIIEVYKLPPEQRKATIDFGLQPDILPILALTFSVDADKRVEAARQLAKVDKPQAAELLGRLLADQDRAVYLAAMEAVWDKKPNDAIVDALWDRAVDAAIKMYEGNYSNVRVVEQNLSFRGRPVAPVNFYDNSSQRRMLDGNIATDVLIHIKAPQVAAKVREFLEDYERAATGHGRTVNMWLYSANSDPMKNALRIIDAYKSNDTVKVLYRIATSPVQQPSQGNMNGQKFFWSNRTMALATLVETLNLKPADYNLKRSPYMGGIWTTPTEDDENDAVKDIKKYWAAHADTLGQPENAKAADATQPADAPEPAETPMKNQPQIMIQPGGIVHMQIKIAPAPPATEK